MPRWIVEPFLKEFVVTPGQTWLINEMQNEIRRVYTDGRDHPSEADAYPLWEGDSIGFWDGDKLVIHTSQMRAGQYQRSSALLYRASRNGRDLGEDGRRRRWWRTSGPSTRRRSRSPGTLGRSTSNCRTTT